MGRGKKGQGGQRRGVAEGKKVRGKGEGLHKDRRKKEREEARKVKKALKRAKLAQVRAKKGKDIDVDKMVSEELDRKKKDDENRTRESFGRRRRQKRKLQRAQLEKEINEFETRMVCWYPGKEEHLKERERLKRMKEFDPERLRGPAKPAEEAYPWLYPDYHEAKQKRELEEERAEQEKGDNILEKYKGHWGTYFKTRELLGLKLELAQVYFEQANNGELAQKLLEDVSKMDEDKYLGLRFTSMYVSALIDVGELGIARQVIESDLEVCKDESDSPYRSMLLWDLLLIEYIGCYVLEEKDVEESAVEKALDEAINSNPFIGRVLVLHNAYEPIIDAEIIDQITSKDLKSTLEVFVGNEGPSFLSVPDWTSEEQAVVYFVRAISWWRDAGDEIEDFLEKSLKKRGLTLEYLGQEDPEHPPSKMYSMFQQV
mmetsp:Transcript_4021/g.5865  ORF Transcript_4021/g.5865 Transcript_4021/m.5865 type:complete len:429 (-) Transcript_4021:1004-2290(-)|eukprot:CAMPEP_0203774722 /NCGR_PEP_ID=MMETSP0099_2-20121227/5543_1 /ASSEMBLY_ACC=CAM_ASM_000209 /TAXON_ID=96639 /ORGANISM=" , Strain NY0313808BC1" /LENGTH=428 /DNA_ID=CAMNT_0050673039 /DNA_START=133 /DNA_END=1419 /DNA_ORIENTATION=+